MKDLYRQIEASPKVELCFNDCNSRVQVRVTDTLEQVTDNAYKDEICGHSMRAFLGPWRESGSSGDFYSSFIVCRLKNGSAVWWTMQDNVAPKRPGVL